MSYFLIAVSTRVNLELCLKYGLAGFTSSAGGLWTYLDIQEGDFVSFLYGARVFNLYRVREKAAYRNADSLPPWPPLTLLPSGRTYSFPFRLELELIRVFEESLVKAEFAYVAENLLLRGGYRKTHFQADQTTLQAVSEMGFKASGGTERLEITAETFTPLLTFSKAEVRPPDVFLFQETFLQALVRRYLGNESHLNEVLAWLNRGKLDAREFEVLSEKALPEGHVDLLIKEAVPKGSSRKVVVEVKNRPCQTRDIQQTDGYVKLLGEECLGGLLVCRGYGRGVRQVAATSGFVCVQYELSVPRTLFEFEQLRPNLQLVAG